MSTLPPEVAAFDHAQRMTIELMRNVVDCLEVGMSEKDVYDLAIEQAQGFGFTGWFAKPEVRFNGAKSALHRPSPKRKLKSGMLVELDLAPSTDNAFGDFGIGLAFDTEEEPEIIHEAREACRAVCGFASRHKTVGELFVFAESWANNHRLSLGGARSIGHICPLPDGPFTLQWPLTARMAIFLRRCQVHFLNPRRIIGIYCLSPRIMAQGKAMCFEEMIYIDEDQHRILGRDSIDEIGTL
ncbi:MAG: M24 family metallopeptidase [Myxococcota bacterium]